LHEVVVDSVTVEYVMADGGGFGRGCGDDNSSGVRPVCQLCKKTGHTVLRCWKRFDHNYIGDENVVNSAEGHGGYSVDTVWYSYTG
jgi:hypothetical protein